MSNLAFIRFTPHSLVLLVMLLGTSPWAVSAQQDPYLDLAHVEPAHRFDFLLGNWTYAFNAGGGTVTYEKAVGGTVIRESLEGTFRGTDFAGSSLTRYDTSSDTFPRKWIDTLGNSIEARVVMEPYAESPLPALVSSFSLNDRHFKHVWYNITPDRFETDLLISQDGGATYQLARRMPYLRAK